MKDINMSKWFNFKRKRLEKREKKKSKKVFYKPCKVYTAPSSNITPIDKYRGEYYKTGKSAYKEVISKREKKIRRKKRREIRELINLDILKFICNAPIDILMSSIEGDVIGDEDKYAYKNVGSGILAVAHTDTVQQGTKFVVQRHKDCTIIHNSRLDDRLGVYTITELLPKLGIHLDILLTENEERGCSTAKDFKTDKAYSWLVEFDRCGNDVVSYEYDFEDVLKEFFKPGHGTFSDISMLQELKVKAFNVGVGYQNEHSANAYFVLEQYVNQIERFLRFYAKYKDQRFEHTPVPSLFCGMAMWDDYDDYYYGQGWHGIGNHSNFNGHEINYNTPSANPPLYDRYRSVDRNKYRSNSVITFPKSGLFRIWCAECRSYQNVRENTHDELFCEGCGIPVDFEMQIE